jgi:hypothetical protein
MQFVLAETDLVTLKRFSFSGRCEYYDFYEKPTGAWEPPAEEAESKFG